MSAEKIDKVATLAKSTEQRAAKAFKQGQQGHQQKCEQLQQLINFKQEYETKLGQMGGQGIDARQLQDYRLFLSKLNQAIDQQSQEVEASEKSLEEVRGQWLSESQHKTAVDNLVDHRLKQQRRAEDKAEQKDADEQTLARRVTNPAF